MTQTAKNSSDNLHESAARGLEALSLLASERDNFRQMSHRLETDLSLLQQEVSQLKALLATARTERDHYMRHSTELVANLNNISAVINDAVEKASHAAFSRPAVPAPAKPVAVEDDNIRALLSRLPRNGGDKSDV